MLSPDDRRHIAEALTADVLRSSSGWSELQALSEQTVVDEVDVLSDEISGSRERADGIFNVVVELKYGGTDDFSSADAYPGKFTAHIDKGGRVVFDHISVDTRSFYG